MLGLSSDAREDWRGNEKKEKVKSVGVDGDSLKNFICTTDGYEFYTNIIVLENATGIQGFRWEADEPRTKYCYVCNKAFR